jgi:hypothetical protein
MLYLDMTWCRQQLPLFPSQAQMNAPQPVIRDPELFARYQQIVALMERQQTAALPEQIAQLLRALPLYAAPPPPLRATSSQLFSRLAADLQRRPLLMRWPTSSPCAKRR